MNNKLQTVSFLTRLLLLMPPAFLIGIKYDLPHVALLTFLFTLLPFFIKPLKGSVANILLILPAIVLLVLIPDAMFEASDDRMALNDAVLRTHFFVPLLLYITGMMCTMRRTRELCGFIALICIFSMLICNDIYNVKGMINTRFPFTTGLLQNYRAVHRIMTFLQSVGILLLLISDARAHTLDRSQKIWFFRLGAFLLIPAALLTLTHIYDTNINVVKELQKDLYRNLRHMHRYRHSRQRQVLNISDPRSLTGAVRDNTVLIRVYSTTPPGYLRGRSYDIYSVGGNWRNSRNAPEPQLLMDLALDKELALSYYPLQADSRERRKIKWEIFISSSFFTDYLPIPGNALAVEMVSDSAKMTADGVILPQKHSAAAGYSVFLEKAVGMSASPVPAGDTVKNELRYLQLPRETAMKLSAFMPVLFPEGTDHMSKQQIIDRIVSYLRNNFTYTLNPKPAGLFRFLHTKEPPSDPVERFLFYTRSGHCELFASSGVLLLRAAGIPARYITGFICDDHHDAGYYYSTARNAHAWLEAYNETTRSWQAYDPTPPDTAGIMANPVPGPVDVFFAKLWEPVRKGIALLFRGYPVKYFNQGIMAISDFILFLFTTIKGAVCLCLFLMITGPGCVYIWRKKYKGGKTPAELLIIRRLMHKIERQTSHRRTPESSWQEWSSRFADKTWYPELEQLIRDYESMRYRSALPTEERLHDFRRKAAKLLAAMKQEK